MSFEEVSLASSLNSEYIKNKPIHMHCTKLKSKSHINKMELREQIRKLECLYTKLYLFYSLPTFKAYVKMILSHILDALHAISSGALHQRLDSPSSYAAFILLRILVA